MDSQLLVQELQRLQTGADGAESRVLFLISRSSLYLLTENDPTSENSAESLVIKAKVATVDNNPTAYFFSSEGLLQQWCIQKQIEPHSTPIHGADVPFALQKGTWIQIDPDTPYATLLSPEQLDSLNAASAATPMGVMVAPEADLGFVSMVPPEGTGSAPAVYRPMEAEVAAQSATEGPKKRRFIPRSHPTTLFAAPQLKKDPDFAQPKEQSYTASKLNKVIRPNKPEGEEK